MRQVVADDQATGPGMFSVGGFTNEGSQQRHAGGDMSGAHNAVVLAGVGAACLFGGELKAVAAATSSLRLEGILALRLTNARN
jgi:hypothetical protein